MDKVWYYMKNNGQKIGPFNDEELVSLIRNGILEKEDSIWMTELDKWHRLENTVYSVFLREE
ncbi:MAG: DUF4339 domain-containing protein [Solobacterium sp.]|nr:DUF4339 domain-containing protein [Solobacterium sp.]